jgi:2-polyprenyl-3-methyl-5-hydroxy-6-metoxy-1,4-benzoquinol methylase
MEKVNKTEKFWDKMASQFDQRDKNFEQTHSLMVESTKKYLHAGDIVLDYGCATGTVAFEISDHVKEVHGIDISSKMIAVAKKKAVERKIENSYFAQATLFDERFKKESFDVILALNILLHLEDTPKEIQRINELLKPGGLIISVTACMGEKKNFSSKLLFFGVFFLVKTRILPNIRFFKVSELEESITNGYFQIVESKSLNHGPTIYFIAAKKA